MPSLPIHKMLSSPKDTYRHWGDPPPPPNHRNSFSGTRYHDDRSPDSDPRKRQRTGSLRAASSEPGDDVTPGHRPLAITCAPCRSRKIKCDSRKPTCENCSKNPSECVYPVKLKPGLRPGTGVDMIKRIELLEERVQTYESRLMDQEARLSQVSNWQQGSTSNLAALNTPLSNLNSTLSFNVSDMPGSVGSVNLDMGQGSSGLDLGSGSGGMDLSGPGSGGPLDFSSFGTNASPGALSSASFRDPMVLPPEDIVRDLISLFFTHIHPWAPILSPNIPMFTPPWNIVVYAIVVVSLRLSTDPRLAANKQQYRAAAKQHVLSHAIESTSIASIQALALLALDLIGSDQGPSSWGILALLTRSAVHLGLVVEEDNSPYGISGRAPSATLSRMSIIPPAANWQEDEARRRLFWLIFCLDRYACVSTGWDFALPDFEIKRRLPCSDELWSRNEWHYAPAFKPVLHREAVPESMSLSPFAYLVEALDLLGRSHTLHARVVEPTDGREIEGRKDMTITLTSAAKRWFSTLRVKDGEQTALTVMIQGIHHATLLKLNAYYAYPALSNGAPMEPFATTCLTSVKAVVALTATARSLGFMSSSTPLFIWSCWVAARVSFVNSFLSGNSQPDSDFDTIVKSLKEQSIYWALATQYTKLLERAKRKWLSNTNYDPDLNPNLPEAIHVLLDLRRTAYSAVGANNMDPTPHATPPDVNLSHLPAWAVQPLLGDLHSWFDLPAGLFQGDTM